LRISISKVCVAIAICVAPTHGFAAASSYLCAISEAYECMAVTGCKRAALEDINLSPLILVDLDKKQLTSVTMGDPARTEDIEGVSATDKAVFLHGTQGEGTWNAIVSLENGALTGGISIGTSSFSIFGNCTPK
jgi:hypothetical protein